MKYRITVDKCQYEVRVDDIRSRPILATVDGETFEVWPEEQDGAIAVPLVSQPAALSAAIAEVGEETPPARGAHREVRAPLPGTIISLGVAPGATVCVGQELCVLEAMKMKNPIRATRPGTIRAVHVAVGQTVKHQDLLLEFAD